MGVVASLMAGVLVVLVVIGGALDTGRGSIAYRREINLSYAAAAAPIVGQSNEVGGQLGKLMGSLSTATPTGVREGLGSIGSAAAEQAEAVAALSPPAPSVVGLSTAMDERASAVAQLKSAIFGLIGLGRGGRPDRSAGSVAATLVEVGSLLEKADRLYASVRAGFRRAPGEPRLPRSRWVGDAAAWSPGPVQSLVEAAAGLVVAPKVVLVAGTLGLKPAAVPRPGGGTTVVVPPTRSLGVSVVVADTGSGGARSVPVTASLSRVGKGTPDAEVKKVSLTPSGSVSMSFGGLRVVAGESYTLTIGVPGSSEAVTLRVAPGT